MHRIALPVFASLQIFAAAQMAVAQEVLFEDTFDNGLSPTWTIVGLKKDDYRVKDGGLEMRVQPGRPTEDTPMLKVLLPFETSETVSASVELTLLDSFTEPCESAGLFLIDESSREFGAEKMYLNGHLVFSPSQVEYIGKDGSEGDPQQYALKFWPANDACGALKIIVRDDYGFLQVGPSKDGEYLNFFHSALRPKEPKRGFCLSASGGPTDASHWVRFDNFRVTRN